MNNTDDGTFPKIKSPWPFSEPPGEVATRLQCAYFLFIRSAFSVEAAFLAAVRNVFIEDPSALGLVLGPTQMVVAPFPDAMFAALKPLAAIADRWDEDGLDEDRPDWRKQGIGGTPPYDSVQLFSGRGGATLLTLADAFAARLARGGKGEPNLYGLYEARPAIVDGPDGPEFTEEVSDGHAYSMRKESPENKAFPSISASHRSFDRDLDYLSSASAHADEGQLGEAAARSILDIALHWMRSGALDAIVKNAQDSDMLRRLQDSIRSSFPELEAIDNEHIGPEDVARVGAEHVKMLLEWAPIMNSIDPEPTANVEVVTVPAILALADKMRSLNEYNRLGMLIEEAFSPPVKAAADHAPWCNIVTSRRLPRQPCNCPATAHKPECSTRCREQAIHQHDCDCGKWVS